MIHIRAAEAALRPQALGAGYTGPESYSDTTEVATADGAVQVGVWAYDGRLESTNDHTRHQIWIVLRGHLRVEMEAESIDATAGDAVVFEAPYGPKTIVASDDFRAIWVGASPPPRA